HYIPLGDHDIEAVVAEIERLKPDVVLNSINGDSNIAFFHALKDAGISAKEIPVISFSMGETVLAQMHGDADATGHYAVWNYFQSIDNQKNRDFIQAFQIRFGSDIPLSDPMEAAWLGVKLWAKAVRAAQTDDVGVIRTSIGHQSIVAPEGIVSIDHHSHHSWKTVRIGQIRSDGQFDILWTSAEPVRPDPFPPFISKPEAALKLEQLYQAWGNQWAKPASSNKSLGSRP
ncbi:MAG: transporter substrate-binding protein, partial [Mariprofundus sp.]|nr:transporter substrate-binding protein [Mariprofundus sp.]